MKPTIDTRCRRIAWGGQCYGHSPRFSERGARGLLTSAATPATDVLGLLPASARLCSLSLFCASLRVLTTFAMSSRYSTSLSPDDQLADVKQHSRQAFEDGWTALKGTGSLLQTKSGRATVGEDLSKTSKHLTAQMKDAVSGRCSSRWSWGLADQLLDLTVQWLRAQVGREALDWLAWRPNCVSLSLSPPVSLVQSGLTRRHSSHAATSSRLQKRATGHRGAVTRSQPRRVRVERGWSRVREQDQVLE